MWYPSIQQQQQHSWYGYVPHPSSQEQQQQTYSRTSYYYNDDELSTTCIVAIDDENESPIHCKTSYGGSNVHGKKIIKLKFKSSFFFSNNFVPYI